jgi:lipocalin-like protein
MATATSINVELPLFPNWVGSDQQRRGELAGDRLILERQSAAAGRQAAGPRLVWERVDPSPGPG